MNALNKVLHSPTSFPTVTKKSNTSELPSNAKITSCGKKHIGPIHSKTKKLDIPLNQKVAFGFSMLTLASAALSYTTGVSLPTSNLGLAFQVVSGFSLIQNCFQAPYTQTALSLASIGLSTIPGLKPYILGLSSIGMCYDSFKQAQISLKQRNGKNDWIIGRNLAVYTTNALHSCYNLGTLLQKPVTPDPTPHPSQSPTPMQYPSSDPTPHPIPSPSSKLPRVVQYPSSDPTSSPTLCPALQGDPFSNLTPGSAITFITPDPPNSTPISDTPDSTSINLVSINGTIGLVSNPLPAEIKVIAPSSNPNTPPSIQTVFNKLIINQYENINLNSHSEESIANNLIDHLNEFKTRNICVNNRCKSVSYNESLISAILKCEKLVPGVWNIIQKYNEQKSNEN